MFSILNCLISIATACNSPDCKGDKPVHEPHTKSVIQLDQAMKGLAVVPPSAAPVTLRSCTEGYTLDTDGVTCITQIFKDPLYRCPNNGEVDPANNTCGCYVAASFQCPTGFTYDKRQHACSKATLTPMVPSCAHIPKSEISDDGTSCLFSKAVNPRLSCPSGAKLRDNNCEQLVDQPEAIVTTCPTGWVLEEGRCALTDMVPCRIVDNANISGQAATAPLVDFVPCTKECSVNHHPSKNRKLTEHDDRVAPAEDLCQAKECRMKVHRMTKCDACDGLLSAQGVAADTQCERVTHMEPKVSCSVGHLSSGHCRVTVATPATVDCPPGSTKWQGGCFQDKSAAAKHLCPEGFKVSCGGHVHGGRPATAHPQSCECVAIETAECMTVCPDASWTISGKNCIRYEPAQAYCPDVGFSVVDGKCVGLDREPARMEVEVTMTAQEVADPQTCNTCKKTHMVQRVRNTQVHRVNGKNKTICHATRCVDENNVVYPPEDLSTVPPTDPTVFPPLSTMMPTPLVAIEPTVLPVIPTPVTTLPPTITVPVVTQPAVPAIGTGDRRVR